MRAARFCKISIFACSLGLAAQSASSVFSDEEIRIEFAGPHTVRIEPGSTVYRSLIPHPKKTVDFCLWREQNAEVQQVNRPESGYLCEMHILKRQEVAEVMAALRHAATIKRIDHGMTLHLRHDEIHGLRVVRWRFQVGKTRLDHFLVLGNVHNYLFVSSPYGSMGTIEDIIAHTTFLKP